jgi:hypothetical protein
MNDLKKNLTEEPKKTKQHELAHTHNREEMGHEP